MLRVAEERDDARPVGQVLVAAGRQVPIRPLLRPKLVLPPMHGASS